MKKFKGILKKFFFFSNLMFFSIYTNKIFVNHPSTVPNFQNYAVFYRHRLIGIQFFLIRTQKSFVKKKKEEYYYCLHI